MATRTMHCLSIYLYLFAFFMTISMSYSDEKVSYRKLSIEYNNLCSEIAKRKIELNHNALLVTQTSTKRHPSEWTSNFNCVFKVYAASDDGLFAVIRTINFRKNVETGECIDYVQFQGRDGTKSRPFCGNKRLSVVPADLPYSVPLDINDLGFLDRRGKISTTIFISKDPLPTDMDMNLEIVFTSYNRCSRQFTAQCLPDNTNYCIDSAYMSDGYVNCPFRDCGDELSCDAGYFTVDLHEESVSSTKVVISAIGSLAISFLLFIVVLWLCKKAHLICFNEDCMNGGNSNTSSRGIREEATRHNQPSRVIEMENRPEGDVAHHTRPAAAPEEDKDLPPSYDSLFANR